MSAGSDQVVALRRLLDERFPPVRRREPRLIPTGVPALDRLLSGGLVTGTLTEWVSAVPSGGSQLSLGRLLQVTRRARQRVALVDVANAFDPTGLPDEAVAHLVVIRCGNLADGWRAADLAARDSNYAVVVVDTRGAAERDVQRTRDAIWTRLQRAAEQAETALVIQTTTASVPNAAVRLRFATPLAADGLLQVRSQLVESLVVESRRVRPRVREASA